MLVGAEMMAAGQVPNRSHRQAPQADLLDKELASSTGQFTAAVLLVD